MEKPNEIDIPAVVENTELFNDVCQIIDQARRHVATYANVEAVMSKWRIGKRIKENVLFNKRAEYGKQILENLSIKLTEKYGKGWGLRVFNIVYALRILFQKKKLPTHCVYNCRGPISAH